MTYRWALTTVPAGSLASLSGPGTVAPTFVADQPGTYVAQLVVNDSMVDSNPDTISITAQIDTTPQPPALDPIGNQTAALGTMLTLQLTASDPNGDVPTFSVEPLPLPDNASLNAVTGVFTFEPDADQVGTTVLTFIVSDGVFEVFETIRITVQGAPPGSVPALTGRLLDTNAFVQDGTEVPVVSATVSLLGAGVSTRSDANGRFTLSNTPAGSQVLDIDTRTADVAPHGSPYAGFREAISLIEGVTNVVDRPFFLPRIDVGSLTPVDPGTTTVVTNPTLDVTMTVPPLTAKNPDGTDFTGELSISEVPDALAPAALPEVLRPGLLITIQPVGVTFATPVPITFPKALSS